MTGILSKIEIYGRDTRCSWCCRDNENAFVSVNGDTCWTKTDILATRGTQQCGGFFKEERFRVTGCYVDLAPSQTLTVRVWTDLDGNANDESFGIDNVVISEAKRPVNGGTDNKFDNQNDFEGWNCGRITACGDMGQFCGGFNVKGSGADLTKTFSLPPGVYSIELDFIKIDSWFVRLI